MNCLNSVLLEGYITAIKTLDSDTSLITLALGRANEVSFFKAIIKNNINNFLLNSGDNLGLKVKVIGRLVDHVTFKTIILVDHLEIRPSLKKIFNYNTQLEFKY